MANTMKTARSATSGKFVTRPLGKGKAERFAAVDGMQKNEASKRLSDRLSAHGLKGDDYRAEVTRAFKKT